MRPLSSWNPSTEEPTAKSAALAAAQDEGIPLGEWFKRQILQDFEANKPTRNIAETLDHLDRLTRGLTDRLGSVEEHVQADPLRNAVKKLHDGLAKLNAESM